MRNLHRLENAIDDKVQTRILLNAAGIVVARAKDLAPVRTGQLRDSISASTTAPREMSFSIRDSGVRVFIGPSAEVWYAPYVEFGNWKHDGHPFMRPAMDQTRDQVQAALAHGIWSTVKSSIRA